MTHEDSAERGGPAPDNPPTAADAKQNATTPIPAGPHPQAPTEQLPAAGASAIPAPSEPAETAELHASPAQPEPSATGPGSAPSPSGPGPSGPPPRPSRRAQLAARWHHSLPLRVVTAVVVALLIGGIGFAAGTAFTADGGRHRSHHEISANHPFWQDREGWFHRGEHIRHHLRLAPAAPPTAPAPSPAPGN